MADGPAVTVIVPTHDRAELLPRAVGSVRAQTLDDWECLLVDDGSTDETPRVAAELAAEDRRIRYLRGSHAGIVGNLNRGVDAARGEWVQIVDDDDRIHPDKLGFQLEWARRHDVPAGPAVLYGDYVVVRSAPDGTERTRTQVVGERSVEELLHGMIRWNGGSDAPLRQGSPLVRRSVFERTRFDTRVSSYVDTKFYMDLLLRGVPFFYTPIAGYYQYLHDGNYTSAADRSRRQYVRYLDLLSTEAPELVAESPRFGFLASHALSDHDLDALRDLLRIARRTPYRAQISAGSGTTDVGPLLRWAARLRCPAFVVPYLARLRGLVRRADHQFLPHS